MTEEGRRDGHGEGAQGDSAQEGAGPASEGETFYCDLCGNEMLNLHCKLICERCGYKRDCSDP